MALIPSIPTISPDTVRPALSAIKQIIEIREGHRDANEAFVTVADLLSDSFRDTVYITPIAGSVTGGAQPNPVTDFTVTKGMWINTITWTNPADSDLAKIEIWRHTSDDVSSASLLGIVTAPGTLYIHNLEDITADNYYWARAVNEAGNYSTWKPTSGGFSVPGTETVSETIGELLTILNETGTTITSWDELPFVVGNIDGTPHLGVNGAMVIDGSLLARHIYAGTITGDKIAGTTIEASHMATNSITVGNMDSAAAARIFDSSTRDFADLGGVTKPDDNATITYPLPSDEYLLGHWTFDEVGVGYVSDKSVFANHGVLQGTSPETSTKWVQSPRGLGYNIGLPNRLLVANGTGIEDVGLGSTSFSMWLKTDSTTPPTGANEYILYKSSGADNVFYFGHRQENYLRALFLVGGVPNYYYKNFSTFDEADLYDQEWHHVVVVFDYDNDEVALYMDGVDVDSGSPQTNSLIADMSNTGDFSIGYTTGNEFNGAVSDVRIYSKALTADEVKALYYNPVGYPSDSTQQTLQQGTTITGGGITLSGGGVIKTLGKDTYTDTTEGIFLGYDSGLSDYALGIGNATNYLTYRADTGALEVAGNIIVKNASTVRTALDVSEGADVTQTALISGTTITGGGITLSNGGSINSANKTSYADTDAGFFLGYDSGYKFNIGDSLSWFKWTGSTIDIKIASDETVDIDGTLNMGVGSDIHMEATSGDRARIDFVVDTYEISITADYTAQRLAIFPDTDGYCHFSVGYDQSGTEKKFDDIYIAAQDYAEIVADSGTSYAKIHADTTGIFTDISTYLHSYYDANHETALTVGAGPNTNDNYVNILVEDSGVYAQLFLWMNSAVPQLLANVDLMEIDQETADGNILQFASSDVDHPFQNAILGQPADVYGSFRKCDAGGGGLSIWGMSDESYNGSALQLVGIKESTTHTTGPVAVYGYETNGSDSVQAVGATDMLFSVHNGTSAVFHIDGDGDIYYDAAHAGTYDEYEDIDACQDLAKVLSGDDTVSVYNKDELKKMNVIKIKPGEVGGEDRVYSSVRNTMMLQLGAFRELAGVVKELMKELGVDYTVMMDRFRETMNPAPQTIEL